MPALLDGLQRCTADLMNTGPTVANWTSESPSQPKVAGCHLVESSGVPVFDIRACQVIIEQAKFVPAKDRLGESVQSAVTSPPIKWIIR